LHSEPIKNNEARSYHFLIGDMIHKVPVPRYVGLDPLHGAAEYGFAIHPKYRRTSTKWANRLHIAIQKST
jgi:hypothetical protein